MLQHYGHLESFPEDPASLMSLGPSPATGAAAPRRPTAVRHHRGHHAHNPAYLCPIPLKSNSSAPNVSAKRKPRPGESEKTQRQASEEISHILRRPKENLMSYDLDQHLLDGSRSADMFVGKKHMGSSGVHHFATPPIGTVEEVDQDDSDSDDVAHPAKREASTDFLSLHELRDVMSSPSQPLYIRSASIQDLAVMADSNFTPPTRSQNPLPRSSPFVISTGLNGHREGAEIGLLSFSPPNAPLDEELRARRARFADLNASSASSDFKNRQRFGDLTPRGTAADPHH